MTDLNTLGLPPGSPLYLLSTTKASMIVARSNCQHVQPIKVMLNPQCHRDFRTVAGIGFVW